MKQYTLKKQITDYVVEHKGYAFKEAWHCIWQNTLKDGGLRLSPQGFVILGTELGIEFYLINIQNLTLNYLYRFDQLLPCPYYLMPKTMALFSERTAVELALYQDNIGIYLENNG